MKSIDRDYKRRAIDRPRFTASERSLIVGMIVTASIGVIGAWFIIWEYF